MAPVSTLTNPQRVEDQVDDSVDTASIVEQVARAPQHAIALPFAHLNLRFNPFGERPLDERAKLAVVDIDRWVPLLDPARGERVAVQFMGDKGRGKTTHMLALLDRVRRDQPGGDAAYLHVGEGERPPMPGGSPVFVDEIQRVPRWRRWKLFRRGVPLVIGTHLDVARELRRAGYVVHSIHPAEAMTAERLAAIVERRIEHARRGPGPLPGVSAGTVSALLDRFGDDVRAIEHRLYETYQGLTEVRDV